MQFELDDRFLRDLNPNLHFKATVAGYRLTSAVFRHKNIGNGRSACSVDSERIAGDQAEHLRIGRGRKNWGAGRVMLGDVKMIGEGDVTHEPEDGNNAHCTLIINEKKARDLAQACEVIVEPTDATWQVRYAGRRRE